MYDINGYIALAISNCVKFIKIGLDIFEHEAEEVEFLCGKSHDRSNNSAFKRAGSEKGKIHWPRTTNWDLQPTGKKHILGLIEGGSENSSLVKDLFDNLFDCSLTCTDEVLFVLDGSKALRKAVNDRFGKRAIVQRCQIHKMRNVQSYMPKRLHGEVIR